MPFVKILLYERFSNEQYYDEDGRSGAILVEGISGWEFVEDSDLKFLQANMNRIFPYNDKYIPRIVYKDMQTVAQRIDSIKDVMK